MRISRIYIRNFRNFKELDVALDANTVIVGENRVGKSNLIFALRLLLDPTLPDSARQLRQEDFWDGLPRPLKKTDQIEISIEFAGFENTPNLLASLGDHLVQPKPMVARLTYLFQSKPTLKNSPEKDSDFEFIVFGGGRPEKAVSHNVRRRIPLNVLPALRDAESDLGNWRNSPLRPLLDAVASQIDKKTLKDVAMGVSAATNKLKEIVEINTLQEEIREQLDAMVGPAHSGDTVLGFSPTDPQRLIRTLRILVDGGVRGIAEASLGTANLLYLGLKSLEMRQLIKQGDRDHVFLAIEEPEAHLHPHLQRLTYKEFLRARVTDPKAKPEDKPSLTAFLTTHSPHIASVSPLRSIVLLRRDGAPENTKGFSTAEMDLSEQEVLDLERYLDVTRGEMLFAKGVILVEGDAERFLIPALALALGHDLDRLGISVCSVAGTNFTPYVKLLSPAGLSIPFVVLTDYDPQSDGGNLGEKRAVELVKLLSREDELRGKKSEELLRMAPGNGIFLGQHTLEIDLFNCGRHKSMCTTLQALTENKAVVKRADAWAADPKTLDPEQFLKDLETIGKGRFAQAYSNSIGEPKYPPYIKQAIEEISAACG